MAYSWRTTVAGAVVAGMGLYLIMMEKQVVLGVGLMGAGTGLMLARDQAAHTEDRKRGET
jgi:proteasome assembly chaperone (PAC2) family protein